MRRQDRNSVTQLVQSTCQGLAQESTAYYQDSFQGHDAQTLR